MYGILLITSLVAMSYAEYLNDFDGELNFSCPDGETFSRIHSEHSNSAEDRRFELECKALGLDTAGQSPHCEWTAQYVNGYDEVFIYECPGNSFLNGMHSVHSNSAEDRKWKFRCCSYPRIHLLDCTDTGFTNTFDDVQNYIVPDGKAIKSVESYHSNGAEDRRYAYDVCSLIELDEIPSVVG
ncbi:hypothetical protein ACF0H5_019993 [Mactra antiquata]